MRTRTIRGAGAAVLTLGLVTTAFTPAQAATAPAPAHFTRAPITGFAGQRSEIPALRQLAQAPAKSSLADSLGIVEMSSTCPAGQFPKTLKREGFEAGLPYPQESPGFTVATGTGAPDGVKWANSSLLASDPVGFSFVTSNHDKVPQTGKVYLSFAYRGTFEAASAFVAVSDDGGSLSPAPQWTTVALDITSQATTNGDGTVYVGFGHMADVATASSFDVDNVNLYTCATPPSSGVRGDWTGQGTVDLLGTRSDGGMFVYEGKGTGAVGSGVQVGSGWSGFTWQGSPGDLNADRRTDLLARRSDGTLWFYPGKGAGALGSGKQVGTGWNGMTSIATPGDFNLDGHPDLIARRSDGTLHLYRILSTGALQYVAKIGSGWNAMTSIIGMGDLNGDKRGDVVAVRSDGIMFSYLSSGTRLTSAKQVGAGWNGMNILTSPGDMNKDGRGDLIGRRADGTLWSYLGRTGGGVISGKQVGSGWQGMLRIL